MNNPQVFLSREELAELQMKVALLVKAFIEKTHPTLKGQVDVSFEYREDIFYRARKSDGGHVMLKFGIGPAHPRFVEMLQHASKACCDVRFDVTNAQEMRQTKVAENEESDASVN